MVIDCAVVGAGPAGLAASAALGARGVEHVVLERGRAGESWRTQRWESFRLNTPGWMNQLLGEQAADTYATGVEVIQRLDKLAGDCPVRGGVPVAQLAPAGDGHALRTDGDEILARAVVVATGDQNLPKVPALARTFPVDGERVNFDDSVAANVAAGDAFAARATAMVDEIIRRRGLDAPPAEPDDHDAPVDLNPPAWLDLHAEEVGGVVWCTGFSGDFSWLDPALVDLDGQPRHADADRASPRPVVPGAALARPPPLQPPVRLPRRRRDRRRRGQGPSDRSTTLKGDGSIRGSPGQPPIGYLGGIPVGGPARSGPSWRASGRAGGRSRRPGRR